MLPQQGQQHPHLHHPGVVAGVAASGVNPTGAEYQLQGGHPQQQAQPPQGYGLDGFHQ